MAESTNDGGAPVTKHRSPNHPAFPLPKALEKADLLLQRARSSSVPVPVACGYMQVKSTSSSGMRWQATLQEFGLVEADGRGPRKTLKASNLARILLKHPDHDSEEYRSTLRKAALAPRMHRRVWEHLRTPDGDLPPDESLVFTLSDEEWGFSESAAVAFVAQFRETLAFAGLTGAEEETETEGEEPEPTEGDPPRPERSRKGPAAREALAEGPKQAPWKEVPRVTNSSTSKDIPIPLQSGGIAVLSLPYLLDEQDYAWLTRILEGLKRSMLAPSHEEGGAPRHQPAEGEESQ